MPHAHGATAGHLNAEVGHRCIEIQLSAVDELERERRGVRLRDRREVKNSVAFDTALVLDVDPAKLSSPCDATLLAESCGHPGDPEPDAQGIELALQVRQRRELNVIDVRLGRSPQRNEQSDRADDETNTEGHAPRSRHCTPNTLF